MTPYCDLSASAGHSRLYLSHLSAACLLNHIFRMKGPAPCALSHVLGFAAAAVRVERRCISSSFRCRPSSSQTFQEKCCPRSDCIHYVIIFIFIDFVLSSENSSFLGIVKAKVSVSVCEFHHVLVSGMMRRAGRSATLQMTTRRTWTSLSGSSDMGILQTWMLLLLPM